MTYQITLRDHFVKALNQMVTETKGMDATAILLNIVEGYLSPVIDRMAQTEDKAKLLAFANAKDTDTKAQILAVASPVLVVR